jgi:Domain of unknown function (DUF397)
VSLPDQIASEHLWRKANRSANDGACVEVALVDGQLAVRDSKDPGGCWLRYPVGSWRDFTSSLKTEGCSSAQTLAR